MVSFYLVRHGRAESSWPQALLTEEGRRQARSLGRRLAGTEYDALWSSDLPRAVETARLLRPSMPEERWRQHPGLREIDFPARLPSPDADQAAYREWERGALEELSSRISTWLDETAVLGPGGNGNVLVVAHAGPLRVLICLLLGLAPASHWAFRLDCASLTIVERCDDMGTLLLLNDRCHLDGQAGPALLDAISDASGVNRGR